MEIAVLEKGESVAKLGSIADWVEQTGAWGGVAGEGKAGGEGNESTGELAQLSLPPLPPSPCCGGGVVSCCSAGLLLVAGLQGGDLLLVAEEGVLSEGLPLGLPMFLVALPGDRAESLLSEPSLGEDAAAAAFSAFLHFALRF